MTTRNKFNLIMFTALLIGIAVIFFSRNRRQSGERFIYAVPVKTETGWGYKIYQGTEDVKDTTTDRIYIRQDYIPGLPGNHSFVSEADALRVANFVIWKISSGRQPLINSQELDSLGIVGK
jgi:hypothetical protein